MHGYTPLFSEIVSSSIWNEDNATRIVWITLMAMAEADGTVYGSVAGLAPIARVTIQECEKAIIKLSSPDKHSRSKNDEGRRIRIVDGGWQIINLKKYRDKAKSRAAYMRQYRESKKEPNSNLNSNTNTHSNKVTPCNITLHNVTVTKYTLEQCKNAAFQNGLTDEDAEQYFNHFNSQGWKKRNDQPITNLQSHMVIWRLNKPAFSQPKKKEPFEQRLERLSKEKKQ